MNYAEKLIDAIHEAVKQGFTVQMSVNDSVKFATGRTELLYKIRHTASALEYGISISDQTLETEAVPHLTEYRLFVGAMENMNATISEKMHVNEEMVKDTFTTPGDYKP